ncbi:DUF1836 domain-containing protein [uncultured Anaerococcus sp.]|uniref:DUF1836 domain-containing protein n=1 Tax=uncultured Anaerococcus sp. TaxID=293428 RepID=UPI002889B0DA|nr:DUF1836 domain-containing protein [uncultured Anaerococcus sp.]
MIEKINELENINLPSWDSLPNDGIYKEELLRYLNEILRPLHVVEKNLISSSMVNNYVKLGYIDRPEKKKYYRSSIAQLVVISIFKQVISIEDLAKGIDIEMSTFGLKDVYENFENIFNQARKAILTSEKVNAVNISFEYTDHHDKVLSYLAISLFTKLYTQLVIDNRKEI